MKYGKFLPENGTIGFVAPSFGCNIEPYKSAFENAQKVWTKEGYSLSLGPNVYEGCGIGISNTPEKCAQEFNEWYEKEDVDVLISCGGGELMCEILPYVVEFISCLYYSCSRKISNAISYIVVSSKTTIPPSGPGSM